MFAIFRATDRCPIRVFRDHGLLGVTELSLVLLNFSLALAACIVLRNTPADGQYIMPTLDCFLLI